jgi:hypothetical protein
MLRTGDETLATMKKKRTLDPQLLKAFREPNLLKAFQDLGRVGGKARAKNLTAEKRHEIAKKAAAARWKKKR